MKFSDEEIIAVAKAIKAEAENFSSPVHLYVNSEAYERLSEDEQYEAEAMAPDLILESWKILARAALSALA